MFRFKIPEGSEYRGTYKKPEIEPEKFWRPETADSYRHFKIMITFGHTQIDTPAWSTTMPKAKIDQKPQYQTTKEPHWLWKKWLKHWGLILLIDVRVIQMTHSLFLFSDFQRTAA